MSSSFCTKMSLCVIVARQGLPDYAVCEAMELESCERLFFQWFSATVISKGLSSADGRLTYPNVGQTIGMPAQI